MVESPVVILFDLDLRAKGVGIFAHLGTVELEADLDHEALDNVVAGAMQVGLGSFQLI